MSTDKPNRDAANAETEQRGKLIRQMIYAACAVGVLLGILVFFNYLSRPPEKPEAPTFTEPVPVPPKSSPIRPVSPVAPPEEPPVDDPEASASSLDGQLPPPVPVEQPAPPLAPGPAPVETPAVAVPPPVSSTPAQTMGKAPVTPVPAAKPPVAPPAAPVPPPVEDVPELTAPPSVALPPEPRPATTPAPPTEASTSAAPRPPTGFVVQAGVFIDPRRAEDLHAKLVQNGIPAILETRVQVGPFKTQAEAQAVKAKMKALGIDSVVLPPPPRR
jgi:DedD protein